MGLVVSILIVFVGVIEVFSCYEHFRNGIIHGATHIYDNLRRRSTFFESAGRKLKLFRNNSLDSIGFRRFHSNAFSSFDETYNGSVNVEESSQSRIDFSNEAKSFKKLEKADKIEIVKRRLEKQQKLCKPSERKNRTKVKTIRSYSMPELEFTPEDVELSQIINELAIEPIAEINFDDQIENEMDLDAINEKFEHLFVDLDMPISKSNNADSKDQTAGINFNVDKVNKLESANFDPSLKINQSPGQFKNSFSKQYIPRDEEPESELGERNEHHSEENRRRHLSLISAFEEKSKTKFINPTVNVQNGVLEGLGGRNRSSKDVEPGSFDSLIYIDADKKQPFVSSDDNLNSGSVSYKNDAELFRKSDPNSKNGDSKVSKEPFATSDDSVDIFSCNESMNLDQRPLEQSLTENLEITELCGESVEEDEFVDDVFEKIYSNLENESVSCVPITDDIDEKPSIDLNEENGKKSKEKEEISKSEPDELISLSIINPFPTEEITHFADKFINFCFKDLRSELIKQIEKVKHESAQNGELLNFNESKIDFSDESNSANYLINTKSEEKLEKTSDFDDGETGPKVEDLDSESSTLVEGLILSKLENEKKFLGKDCHVNDVLNRDECNEKPIGVQENVAFDASLIFENKDRNELFVENGIKQNVDEEEVVSLEGSEVEEKCQEGDLVNETVEPEETKPLSPASIKSNEESINVSYVAKENVGEQKKVAEAEDENEEAEEVEYIIEYVDESDEDADEYDLVLEKSSNSTPGEAKETKEKIIEKVFPVMADQPKTFVLDEDNQITLENVKHEKFNEKDLTLKANTEFLNFDMSSTKPNEDSNRVKKVPENYESRQKENGKAIKIEVFESDEKKMKNLERNDQNEEKRNKSLEQTLEDSDSIDLNEYLVPEEKFVDSTVKDEKNQKSMEDRNSSPLCWLIFSGEYTKAMSKDWHSGHFSCWQCDEALTGQRYVLREEHPYCIKCYESVFANVCEECNKIIGIDSKDLSYKDKHWHEACFLCNKCRVSLVDKQFGSKAEKIYCGNCYDAQFASRCDGCGEIFRAGTKKMEYKTRQWHEKCFCCCVCKSSIGTKSFIPREQEIYCAVCYEEKYATRCVKCNKIITSGGVTYKNEPWHRECFTCFNCNTSLAGQRFTSREEKPYCADCFGELFAKRCTACTRPITGIGGTRFISFEERHWHNDCFVCASCKTSLVGRGFITDGDDIICPECAKQKLM